MSTQKRTLNSSDRNLFITMEIWIAATVVIAPFVIARYPLSIAPILAWATFLAVGTAVWSVVGLWATFSILTRAMQPPQARSLAPERTTYELADMPAVPQSKGSKQAAA